MITNLIYTAYFLLHGSSMVTGQTFPNDKIKFKIAFTNWDWDWLLRWSITPNPTQEVPNDLDV